MKKLILILTIVLTNLTIKSQDYQRGYPSISVALHDDRTQHYLVGLGIGAWAGYTCNYFTEKPILSGFVGMLAGSLYAIGNQKLTKTDIHNTYTIVWGASIATICNIVVFDKQHEKGLYNKWLFEDLGTDTLNIKK